MAASISSRISEALVFQGGSAGVLHQLARLKLWLDHQHEGLLRGAPVTGEQRGLRQGLGYRSHDPTDRGSKKMPYYENLL